MALIRDEDKYGRPTTDKTTATTTKPATPTVGSTYNPQTGIVTYPDGSTEIKFTYEPDTNNPSQLYPTNAGTGERLSGEPIAAPTPQQSNETPIVAPTVDPYAEIQARLNSLKQSRLDSRTSALQKIRDDALSGLGVSRNTAMTGYDSEAASLKPQYYNQRNQMGAQSDVGAKNFAEFMASRGIRGAAAGMPDIYRNAALQGNIGASKLQQSAAENDIGLRRSNTESEFATRQADINRSYEQDLSQAQADIDSDITNQYLAEMQRVDNQRIADLAAQGMTSNGQPTAYALKDTLGAYSDNYQARINELQNDNDPSNDYQIPYLQAMRQQKIKDQEEAQKALEAAEAKAKADGKKEEYDKAMDMWKASGVADASIAPILGVPIGAKTASYDISLMNARTAQTNANKADTGIDSQINATFDDYKSEIQSQFYKKDPFSGAVTIDKVGIANYLEMLQSAGVDQAILQNLAALAGIKVQVQ